LPSRTHRDLIMGVFQPGKEFETDKVDLGAGKNVEIRSQVIFRHGLDGLRLWDSGIVLSRLLCAMKMEGMNVL
jgi:hypothetical protein